MLLFSQFETAVLDTPTNLANADADIPRASRVALIRIPIVICEPPLFVFTNKLLQHLAQTCNNFLQV
nr:MAG TPA: hypothetical protein [Caudoviricetes sp.]